MKTLRLGRVPFGGAAAMGPLPFVVLFSEAGAPSTVALDERAFAILALSSAAPAARISASRRMPWSETGAAGSKSRSFALGREHGVVAPCRSYPRWIPRAPLPNPACTFRYAPGSPGPVV